MLELPGVGGVSAAVLVVDVRPLGFDVILGMNGISALGGVTIAGGAVRFGLSRELACAGTVGETRIEEKDFCAVYEPSKGFWTVQWKWAGGVEPGVLRNHVGEYAVPRVVRDEYEGELRKWIDDGWLVPYDDAKLGQPKGLIPLMAVVQQNKSKVRPVLDFRELNEFIDAYTAEADVCSDKLREWRKQGVNVSVVDLKNAYLQIRVHQSLWPYQTVVFGGRRYCLTRLGLGLNVGPAVMKAVLSRVLSMDPEVERGTSSYVDDILVNEDVVSAASVRELLGRQGLVAKEPERACDGARLLGLSVWGERGALRWRRDNDFGGVPARLTRRSVFSLCGKLVGHYPVCGWLRVAVSYIKRRANQASEGWDDPIVGDGVQVMLSEVLEQVQKDDPVCGRWDVSGDRAKVWVDASSLATGVVIEVGGSTIEDASWLRTDDASHINMAELDAVIKGLNVALVWGFRDIELLTDSSTVHRWISDGLTGRSRLKTKASSEMLIRRRVDIVTSLVAEYGLQVAVRLVPSADNKADALTRVPQRWLKATAAAPAAAQPQCGLAADVSQQVAGIHHSCGHPGVRRTLYFARRAHLSVTRADVKRVVASCDVCQSVDPAPAKWTPGGLGVEVIWQRVAMDITHFRGQSYLSLIDCGPSRFSVWRPLRLQTSAAVIEQLESVFWERGAPEELLTDNDPAFRSRQFEAFATQWSMRVRFRCAHAPAGNGIVERCHRSIKVTAARKNCTVAEAVYWHNVSPRTDGGPESAPAELLYSYRVRVRGVDGLAAADRADAGSDHGESAPYRRGDRVWVRPPGARCDEQYATGTVTDVISEQAVAVDGMPRHVRDLRRRTGQDSTANPAANPGAEDDGPIMLRFPAADVPAPPPVPEAAPLPVAEPGGHANRPERVRRPPGHLADYVTS